MNWVIDKKMTNLKFKIIIESEFINDEPTLMLFEAIIYYMISKYYLSYRFEIRMNVIGYELFKNSLLYKYNNKNIDRESYIKEYNIHENKKR